jgi:hypothetical protein
MHIPDTVIDISMTLMSHNYQRYSLIPMKPSVQYPIVGYSIRNLLQSAILVQHEIKYSMKETPLPAH